MDRSARRPPHSNSSCREEYDLDLRDHYFSFRSGCSPATFLNIRRRTAWSSRPARSRERPQPLYHLVRIDRLGELDVGPGIGGPFGVGGILDLWSSWRTSASGCAVRRSSIECAAPLFFFCKWSSTSALSQLTSTRQRDREPVERAAKMNSVRTTPAFGLKPPSSTNHPGMISLPPSPFDGRDLVDRRPS